MPQQAARVVVVGAEVVVVVAAGAVVVVVAAGAVVVVVAAGAVVVVVAAGGVVVVVAAGAVVVVVAAGAVVVVVAAGAVVVVVSSGAVVVVVSSGVVVVVVSPDTHVPSAAHASQQLDCDPTHAVPLCGGLQFSSRRLMLHIVWPCSSVRQQVTESGLPQVDCAAQWTTSSLHSSRSYPSLTAAFATRSTQLTYWWC